MNASVQILLIAILLSVACSIPGTFLILRNMAMMTDAIAHSVLLGIVLAYFLVPDLDSPFLVLSAGIMGVFMVWFTETLQKTKLLGEDAAIGLVFPCFFSLAIVLITKYASSVHLDVDAVLLGEIAFAPFDPLIIGGINLGAKAIYQSLLLLLGNVIFLHFFFKELSLCTFDPILALTLGISPVWYHYAFMTLVSVSAVTAFQWVGSILLIAFMIIPANIAYLLVDDIRWMVVLSGCFAALAAVIGVMFAFALDISLSGSIAVTNGILFSLVFLLSPKRNTSLPEDCTPRN